MKTVAIWMRFVSIAVNILLCIVLSSAVIITSIEGGTAVLMWLVVFTGAVNVLVLGFSRQLICGIIGVFAISLAAVLNLCSLGGVIFGLLKWGFPEEPLANTAIILWLIFPLLTMPSLVLNRIVLNKPIEHKIINCPHCGGEVRLDDKL